MTDVVLNLQYCHKCMMQRRNSHTPIKTAVFSEGHKDQSNRTF